MRFTKLLVLGAAAAVIYRRFFAGRNEGREETERAEPFSSDSQRADEPPAAERAEEAGQGDESAEAGSAQNGDLLTQPSWLKPTDG